MRPWTEPPDDEDDLERELEHEYGTVEDPGLGDAQRRKRDKREQEARDFEIELQVSSFRASLDRVTADDFRGDL